MSTIEAELVSIHSDLKNLIKLVRKIKAKQDDPLGEKAKARAENNGFNRKQEITPELRAFLNAPEDELVSRSEVTRRVNTYINENGLKHPDNGRALIMDDKLRALLNPPAGTQVTFLNIQKYLSPHYIKQPKEPKEPKAPKEPKEPKEPKAPKEPKEETEPKEPKRPVVKKVAATVKA